MVFKSMQRVVGSILPVLFVIGLLAGCDKPDPWGDPDSGLILTYRMPEGQTLNYELSFDQAHTVMMMGELRRFGNGRSLSFSLTSGEATDENLALSIIIESMQLNVLAEQRPVSRKAKRFEGFSFGMTLSPWGQVLGFSGESEQMKYLLAGTFEQSIEVDFRDLLPLLPDVPLKVGDTWNSTGKVPGESFNDETTTRLEFSNTLEGFETIDGLECVKVAVEITGYLETTGETGPDLAVSEGDVKGEGTWYFAYKEGRLVRMTTKVHAKATQSIGGSAVPPAPVTERTVIELDLVQ